MYKKTTFVVFRSGNITFMNRPYITHLSQLELMLQDINNENGCCRFKLPSPIKDVECEFIYSCNPLNEPCTSATTWLRKLYGTTLEDVEPRGVAFLTFHSQPKDGLTSEPKILNTLPFDTVNILTEAMTRCSDQVSKIGSAEFIIIETCNS